MGGRIAGEGQKEGEQFFSVEAAITLPGCCVTR